jgi:hypothetical protein
MRPSQRRAGRSCALWEHEDSSQRPTAWSRSSSGRPLRGRRPASGASLLNHGRGRPLVLAGRAARRFCPIVWNGRQQAFPAAHVAARDASAVRRPPSASPNARTAEDAARPAGETEGRRGADAGPSNPGGLARRFVPFPPSRGRGSRIVRSSSFGQRPKSAEPGASAAGAGALPSHVAGFSGAPAKPVAPLRRASARASLRGARDGLGVSDAVPNPRLVVTRVLASLPGRDREACREPGAPCSQGVARGPVRVRRCCPGRRRRPR